MNYLVNLELLSNPMNWVIVFLILYGAAIATQLVMQEAGKLNINL